MRCNCQLILSSFQDCQMLTVINIGPSLGSFSTSLYYTLAFWLCLGFFLRSSFPTPGLTLSLSNFLFSLRSSFLFLGIKKILLLLFKFSNNFVGFIELRFHGADSLNHFFEPGLQLVLFHLFKLPRFWKFA